MLGFRFQLQNPVSINEKADQHKKTPNMELSIESEIVLRVVQLDYVAQLQNIDTLFNKTGSPFVGPRFVTSMGGTASISVF